MWDTLVRWWFALWGAAVSLYHVSAIWQGWRARRWPTTTARVVHAGVRYHEGGRGGGYLPDVSYEYAVGGDLLAGSRLRFGGGTLVSERRAEAALLGTAAGAEVAVHYNPRRPQSAVLQPGFLASDLVWRAAGLVALVVGVLGLPGGARAA